MSTLLVSLLAITISLACAAVPPPVYDTDGHEVRSDASYYILPANPGRGGGLTMSPRVLRCPLFVAQAAEGRDGFPVRFTPHGAPPAPSGRPDRTVRLSSDVHIRFDAYTTCVQSTEWHIGDGPLSARRHVVTGPVMDPISPSGRENTFRIEKYGGAKVYEYKLEWCRDTCQDLGVFREEKKAQAWLGTSKPTHVVVFKKAPSPFKIHGGSVLP